MFSKALLAVLVCFFSFENKVHAFVSPIAFPKILARPFFSESTTKRTSFVMQTLLAEQPRAADATSVSTATSSSDWRSDLPEPLIESEVGADYIPLLTALKLGHYEEADQMTRDLLIFIGGEGPRKRGFVYFAEAPKLPVKDLQTIDRLWLTYSKGKFGYSVQKSIWNSPVVEGDFNLFVQTIDWTKAPCGGCTSVCSGCTGTLRRWLPMGGKGNEFVYDVDKAPKGHLPLTSALRGTYLLKSILAHQAFGDQPLKGAQPSRAAAAAPGDGGGDGGGGGGWSGPMSGTVAASLAAARAAGERLLTTRELRFPDSPYAARRQPWDS